MNMSDQKIYGLFFGLRQSQANAPCRQGLTKGLWNDGRWQAKWLEIMIS